VIGDGEQDFLAARDRRERKRKQVLHLWGARVRLRQFLPMVQLIMKRGIRGTRGKKRCRSVFILCPSVVSLLNGQGFRRTQLVTIPCD
jgi:hypothetical protein